MAPTRQRRGRAGGRGKWRAANRHRETETSNACRADNWHTRAALSWSVRPPPFTPLLLHSHVAARSMPLPCCSSTAAQASSSSRTLPPLHFPRVRPLSCYHVWVRPWIRVPVVLLCVFAFFSLCGNLATYRSNSYRRIREQQIQTCLERARAENGNKEGDGGSSNNEAQRQQFLRLQVEEMRLLAAAAVTAASSCPELLHPLPDWLLRMPYVFDPPPPHGSAASVWMNIVDWQPLLWPVLMLWTLLWWRRGDLVRIGEVAALESVMLVCKGVAQVLTTLPDANGKQRACNTARFETMGWWIVTRISTEYCSDMVWSGHTFHTLLAMIMIGKCLQDDLAERVRAEEAGEAAASPLLASGLPSSLRRPLYLSFVLLMAGALLVELVGLMKVRLHYSLDLWLALVATALAARSAWMRPIARAMLRPHFLDEIVAEWRSNIKQRGAEAGGIVVEDAAATALAKPAEPPPLSHSDVELTIEQTAATSTRQDAEIDLEFDQADAPMHQPQQQQPQQRPQGASPDVAAAPGDVAPAQLIEEECNTIALALLRNSHCAMRYLSFPTRRVFESSMQRVAS